MFYFLEPVSQPSRKGGGDEKGEKTYCQLDSAVDRQALFGGVGGGTAGQHDGAAALALGAEGADAELDEVENSAQVHVNHPVARLLQQAVTAERVGKVVGFLRHAGICDADVHVPDVGKGLPEAAPVGHVAVPELDSSRWTGVGVGCYTVALFGRRAAVGWGRCKVTVEGFVDRGDVEDMDESTSGLQNACCGQPNAGTAACWPC